jgi:signal transduction histidine kinase
MALWKKKKRQGDQSIKDSFTAPLAPSKRRRIYAQQTVDALADIADLPMALLRRPEPIEIHKSYSSRYIFFRESFRSADEFRKFVAAANENPSEVVRRLDADRTKWRPIFIDLSTDLFLTRETRAEPVVRLLRDHWSWRWTEMLAFYDKLLKNDFDDPTLRFYEFFSQNVWLCTIFPCDESDEFLLLGPVKNKNRPADLSAQLIATFVQRYYEIIKPHISAIHPTQRYEQFFYDRASIYPADLLYLRRVLGHSLKLGAGTEWPVDHSIDSVDIVALSEFTFFIADLFSDPWRISPQEGEKFSISHYYPLFLQTETHEARQLLFSNAGQKSSAKVAATSEYLRFAKVSIVSRRSPKALYFQTMASPEKVRRDSDINDHINNRFEQLTRRRRATQSQRLLEELLILRYRLADSFGVLTADGPLQFEDATDQRQNHIARRIARTASQICNADSAVIYRYDHRHRRLVAVGAHIQGLRKASNERYDYKWMEEVGDERELREQSVAYSAADHDRCVSYNEGTDFPPLMYNISSLIPPPHGSKIPNGRSLIAIPIRVFGRLWGVFELVSDEVNAFSYVQIEEMQKICDLIGPYYHEQFMLNILYHMASPLENVTREGEQFDLLAQQAADIFLCGSACIWVRDLINAEQFNCVGFTGRRDLATFRAADVPLPMFDSESEQSVAIEAIHSKKIWVAGQIGVDRFSGAWLEKLHTRRLTEEGYKFIAIAPVYDLDEKAIAVISVYSSSRPFSHNWESWAKYIGSYMGVMITRVHNIKDLERRARRLIAHEVSNAARNVRSSKDKIFEFIRLLPPTVQKPNLLRIWMSDIDTHLDDIQTGIADWAGEKESGVATARIEVVLLATAEERAKSQPASEVVFRNELNRCAQTLGREMRKRAIELQVDYPRYDFAIRSHPENLRMVLNNLIANAVKYSSNGSTIRCGFIGQKYGVRFFIRNIGPPLADGESLRIFDLGFRGQRTQNHVPGSGFGLFIVKRICNFYDIEVSYEAVPVRNRTQNVWHQFNLDFPREAVIGDGWFSSVFEIRQ